MKIQNLIIFTFFSLSITIQAQDLKPSNSLCLNFGSGTVVSIDYERNWRNDKNNNLFIGSIGAGAGLKGEVWTLYDTVEDPEWYFVSPQKATYCIGNGINYLEVGVGGIYVAGNTTQPYIAYPILGYRFIGSNNTTFKFYMTWPISGIQTEDLGSVPFGISLGQLF